MSQKQQQSDGLTEVLSAAFCTGCGKWGAVYAKKGSAMARCKDCWKREAGLLPPLPTPNRIIRKPTIEDALARIEEQERQIKALGARLTKLETGRK